MASLSYEREIDTGDLFEAKSMPGDERFQIFHFSQFDMVFGIVNPFT